MAGLFAERMKYILDEIEEASKCFGHERWGILEKVKAQLDKFESSLADELHDDKIRKMDNKSAVLSWVKELEMITYTVEEELDKWSSNNIDLDARLVQSGGILSEVALCCIPAWRWSFAKVDAWYGLEMIASYMGFHVQRQFLKGLKFVDKRPEIRHEEADEVCMARFPRFYQSYDALPPYMKACLLYTATFSPKGTVIDSEKLILLWMSQGYLGYPPASFRHLYYVEVTNILHKNGADSVDYKGTAYGVLENKGIECLSRLISHSFLEKVESHKSVHKSRPVSYMILDDARDFVTYMARANEHAYGKARSVFFSPEDIPVHLSGSFQQSKHITALILPCCQLDQLPEEVGLLTRLQYLDLSDNPLKQLPREICGLYHLEYLDVHFCYLLSCLPQEIGNLKRMKHLRINHTTEELHDLPRRFKYLLYIRTLDVFWAGGKYKDAIKKLEGLNYLRDICISVHGDVHLPRAKFEQKIYMENLELFYAGEGRKQDIADAIEDMKPPPFLHMLKFEHYPRLALPKWILSESIINNLKRLSLRSAADITSLPALWKLSSLEFLWLYDMPKIRHLGCEFFGLIPSEASSQRIVEDQGEITFEAPSSCLEAKRGEAATFCSLKTLRIEYLENLETWEDSNEIKIQVMPSLEELLIAHCPKLQVMPLRVFQDTPWFKKQPYGQLHHMKYQTNKPSTSRVTEVEIEHHGNDLCHMNDQTNDKPSTSNVALKASYNKLKNFVRDAYMTKSPAEPLKVSIPEGVLGKERVTSYLPIDSLHDWFEKDRSIFVEQMCVWSKHIYELMTPSDKKRVQMASSSLIKTVGRQEYADMRAEDLLDFMMENIAKLYLVPFLRLGHWELVAIVPETEVIYWFDSLQGNISQELIELLNMVERKYVTRNLNSMVAHDGWKVVNIKHKKQVDNWEDGYYVMIWMQKIALEIKDLDLEPHFPTDASSYEPDKLREVDWKWCARIMPEIQA